MNFLLSLLNTDQNTGNATQPNTTMSIILLVIMVALLAVSFFFSSAKRKKYNEEAKKQIEELKIGDKILTRTYICGTIKGITQTTMGKVFLIETGEGKNVGYLSILEDCIYGLDTKEEVVLDAEGNPITTEDDMKKAKDDLLKDTTKQEEKKEDVKTTEEKVEDKAEEVKVEETTAEKPKKTRKSTKKTNKE